MFALDRLKILMPLEHVALIDESLFTRSIRDGKILTMCYNQTTPSLLAIRLDYVRYEATIEFTGKILRSRYKELIRLTNIKQCVDNINDLGIVRIDRDQISRASVLKCDLTIDVKIDNIPAMTTFIKNSICNYDLYSARPKRNGNFVLEKNVDTSKCKRRLTIYDKGHEMSLANNREFLRKFYDGNNPFHGICRFEMNLCSMQSIRDVLGIEDPTVWNVLLSARVKNPISDFLDGIIAGDGSIRNTPDHKAYYYDLVLADNDNDIQKVQARLKSLYAKGTKMSRIMEPIRERLKSRDSCMSLFTRDKILAFVKSETKISTYDIVGYSTL